MSLLKNRLFALPMLVIGCAAFLLIAGSAAAEVPDDNWFIEDDDESEVFGFLQAQGSSYFAQALAVCDGNSTVNMFTEHPDRMKLSNDRGSVQQGVRDNEAAVFVTESGTSVRLTCDRASVKASVNLKKSPEQGAFAGKARNCSCVVGGGNDAAECAAFEANLENLADSCEPLRKIRGRIDFDEGIIKSLSLRGRGEAFED